MNEFPGNSLCQSDDVAAYLDGELDARATLRFEAHLDECPSCRERLREQRSLLCTLDAALNERGAIALPKDFARVVATQAKSDMCGVLDGRERKRALLLCAALAATSFILLGAGLRDAMLRPAASVARQVLMVCDMAGRGLYDAGASLAVVSRSVGGHLIFESHFFGAFALLLLIVSIALLPRLILRHRRAKLM